MELANANIEMCATELMPEFLPRRTKRFSQSFSSCSTMSARMAEYDWWRYSTTFQLPLGLYWAIEAPRAAVFGPRSFW